MNYTPQEWGRKVWSIAEVYLAGSDYSEKDFKVILQAMSFPLRDSEIGCIDCYEFFVEMCEEASIENVEEARNFIWKLKNKIRAGLGKSEMKFEVAANIHHWN